MRHGLSEPRGSSTALREQLLRGLVAAVLGPVLGRAAVQRVAQRRVGAGLEQRSIASTWPPCAARCSGVRPAVRGAADVEMPLARRLPPGRAHGTVRPKAAAHVSGVPRRRPPRRSRRVRRAGRPPRRGWHARPRQGLVQHLLRVVGRLPEREAAVRPVEAAVRSGGGASVPGRPGRRSCRSPEAGGDAQVARRQPDPVDQRGGHRWPQNSAITSGVPPSPRA